MNQNGQNRDYSWTLLWAYAKKPLFRALLCAAVGFGIPLLFPIYHGSLQLIICVAALLFLLQNLVMLVKSIMDAQNDPDRKIVYAVVESAEKKTVMDGYTLVCRGDDGAVYRPLCYHDRCPDLIGTLVPLKVSRYVPGSVKVDTDMIVWDMVERKMTSSSTPYGDVTWSWDESGTKRKWESDD